MDALGNVAGRAILAKSWKGDGPWTVYIAGQEDAAENNYALNECSTNSWRVSLTFGASFHRCLGIMQLMESKGSLVHVDGVDYRTDCTGRCGCGRRENATESIRRILGNRVVYLYYLSWYSAQLMASSWLARLLARSPVQSWNSSSGERLFFRWICFEKGRPSSGDSMWTTCMLLSAVSYNEWTIERGDILYCTNYKLLRVGKLELQRYFLEGKETVGIRRSGE